jgi:hypothetical protein
MIQSGMHPDVDGRWARTGPGAHVYLHAVPGGCVSCAACGRSGASDFGGAGQRSRAKNAWLVAWRMATGVGSGRRVRRIGRSCDSVALLAWKDRNADGPK